MPLLARPSLGALAKGAMKSKLEQVLREEMAREDGEN